MVSSMAGHDRICYTLITAGADVNMTDVNHKTTLTHSIAYCISQSFFAKIRIPVMTFGTMSSIDPHACEAEFEH